MGDSKVVVTPKASAQGTNCPLITAAAAAAAGPGTCVCSPQTGYKLGLQGGGESAAACRVLGCQQGAGSEGLHLLGPQTPKLGTPLSPRTPSPPNSCRQRDTGSCGVAERGGGHIQPGTWSHTRDLKGLLSPSAPFVPPPTPPVGSSAGPNRAVSNMGMVLWAQGWVSPALAPGSDSPKGPHPALHTHSLESSAEQMQGQNCICSPLTGKSNSPRAMATAAPIVMGPLDGAGGCIPEMGRALGWDCRNLRFHPVLAVTTL